jgi:hypothetical protein
MNYERSYCLIWLEDIRRNEWMKEEQWIAGIEIEQTIVLLILWIWLVKALSMNLRQYPVLFNNSPQKTFNYQDIWYFPPNYAKREWYIVPRREEDTRKINFFFQIISAIIMISWFQGCLVWYSFLLFMQLLTEENSSNGCPSDENKLRTRFITSQKLNQLKRSLLESKERIQERTKD